MLQLHVKRAVLAQVLAAILFVFPVQAQAEPRQALSPEATEQTANEAVEFFVRAHIPSNQIDKQKTYFDLWMEPGQKQTLSVDIINDSNRPITVEIEANSASTNNFGVIEYNSSESYEPTSGRFSDVAEVETPLLTVAANSTVTVSVNLEMGPEFFDGHILGGIVVRQSAEDSSLDPATASVRIQNVFTYVVAVVLTETQTAVQPELTLLKVAPEVVDYRATPVHYFQNLMPVIMTGVDLTMDIYRTGQDEALVHEEEGNLDLAPNSVMPYTPHMSEAMLDAGNYTSSTRIEWEGYEWVFDAEFEVTEANASSLNEEVISEATPFPWWIILIVLLFLIILALVAVIVRQNRKLKDQRPSAKLIHRQTRGHYLCMILVVSLVGTLIVFPGYSVAAPGTSQAGIDASTSPLLQDASAGASSKDLQPVSDENTPQANGVDTSNDLEPDSGTTPNGSEATTDQVEDFDCAASSADEADNVQGSTMVSEDDSQQQQLLALEDTSVVVYTASELVAAVTEDNAYTTIYLGADITTNQELRLNANKTALVIDGAPPDSGQQFSYTGSGSGLANTFRVNTAQTLTIKNTTCASTNIYGLVSGVSDSASGTVIFSNVVCNVAQLVYMRGGNLEIYNSTITLGDQELAEVTNVVLGGATLINKTGTSNATLWIFNRGTVRVAEGASVTVQTVSYFIYVEGANGARFIMDDNASFFLTTSNEGFTYASHTLATFSVGKACTFYFMENSSSIYAAVKVGASGSLSVGEGSSFDIDSSRGSGSGIGLGNGASATFSNPARARIYAGTGVPIEFTLSSCSLSISAASINVWRIASSIDEVAAPTFFWNKTAGALCNFSSTNSLGTLSTNIDSTDPVDTLPTISNFDMSSSHLLIFGQYELGIDAVTNQSTAVSGNADSAASLTLTYIDGTGMQSLQGQAADDGGYRIPVDSTPLLNSTVAVISAHEQIYARQITTVQDNALFSLILTVPSSMDFGVVAVATAGTRYNRTEPQWSVIVDDSRLTKSAWELQVRIAVPLTAQRDDGGTHVLEGALVYVDGETQVILDDRGYPLLSQPDNGAEQTRADWMASDGILLVIPWGNVYAAPNYTATLEWILVDAL